MREISVRVSDDLEYIRTGRRIDATGTVSVGLDGVWKELDITAENEKYVREFLEPLMQAGHDPDGTPLPIPQVRGGHGYKINPERADFLKGLRHWCHRTKQMNSAGTGWAYQTNETLKYYYPEKLVKKFEGYLAGEGLTARGYLERERLASRQEKEEKSNG